jgi:hypothetical protein
MGGGSAMNIPANQAFGRTSRRGIVVAHNASDIVQAGSFATEMRKRDFASVSPAQ